MTTGKIVAGIGAGTLIALILIPKTRKVIYDAVCNVTDSLSNLASKAEDLAGKAKDVAGTVQGTMHAMS
jgi:hypothetical protein